MRMCWTCVWSSLNRTLQNLSRWVDRAGRRKTKKCIGSLHIWCKGHHAQRPQHQVQLGSLQFFTLSRFTLSPMKTWRSTASTSFCTPLGILEGWFGTWSTLAGLTGSWCTCWRASGEFLLLTSLLCLLLHFWHLMALPTWKNERLKSCAPVCLQTAGRCESGVTVPHGAPAQPVGAGGRQTAGLWHGPAEGEKTYNLEQRNCWCVALALLCVAICSGGAPGHQEEKKKNDSPG